MKSSVFVVGAFAMVTLSGCIDRSSYESNPVKVKTPQGVVTCQLYTRDRVDWDEAIAVPPGMSKEKGDAYCLQEGARQYNQAHQSQ